MKVKVLSESEDTKSFIPQGLFVSFTLDRFLPMTDNSFFYLKAFKSYILHIILCQIHIKSSLLLICIIPITNHNSYLLSFTFYLVSFTFYLISGAFYHSSFIFYLVSGTF